MTRRSGAIDVAPVWRTTNPFGVLGAFLGSMVIAIVLGAAAHEISIAVDLAMMCLFVCLWSCWSSVRSAVAAVSCAALFGDGFVEDRLGMLSWHGPTDLERLAALAAAALLGLAWRALRAAADRRAGPIPDGAVGDYPTAFLGRSDAVPARSPRRPDRPRRSTTS